MLAEDKDVSLVVHAGVCLLVLVACVVVLSLFIGDLSYGLNQTVWETWGHLVEPVASTRPYLVIPGNWDVKPKAISHFLNRYHMPLTIPATETKPSYYYSVNHALVHIVMMSSYDAFDKDSEQADWLERDLRAVHKGMFCWMGVPLGSPYYLVSSLAQIVILVVIV